MGDQLREVRTCTLPFHIHGITEFHRAAMEKSGFVEKVQPNHANSSIAEREDNRFQTHDCFLGPGTLHIKKMGFSDGGITDAPSLTLRSICRRRDNCSRPLEVQYKARNFPPCSSLFLPFSLLARFADICPVLLRLPLFRTTTPPPAPKKQFICASQRGCRLTTPVI